MLPNEREDAKEVSTGEGVFGGKSAIRWKFRTEDGSEGI